MNNYAISTADLAQSLTKSSASLVAAGGDLAEAAALTATANKIIQDADSVGTALKTTSLRLRGTDVKVLDEEGLDSEGAVTSKSKLQGKVKALSGVDILTATGEYKSTYEILSEIAKVWGTINDMDQAALLELISGKRNSSVIAAILQNPQELEDAYKDAMDAEGSALKENEKYLDSIQGKIDQFNNAVQTLWSDTLDSDVVKFFVDLATQLVKIVDKIGPLNVALVGLVAFLEKKHGIFSNFFNPVGNDAEGLKKQLEKAKQDLAKATQEDMQNGNKKTAQNRRDAEERVAILKSKIQESSSEAILDGIDESFDPSKVKKQISGKKGAITKRAKKLEGEGKTFAEIQEDPKIKQWTQEIKEGEQALDEYNAKVAITDATLKKKNATTAQATAAQSAETAAENSDTAATIAGANADKAAASANTVKTTSIWAAIAAEIASGTATAGSVLLAAKQALANKLVSNSFVQKGLKAMAASGAITAEAAASAASLPIHTLLAAGIQGVNIKLTEMWALLWPIALIVLAVVAALALLAGAIYGLVKLVDWLVVTAKELREELSSLKDEISSIKDEIESLNGELETTQERMAELLAKDSLTFTEQEELENLQKQNDLLEREIYLLEQKEKRLQRQAQKTFDDLMEKETKEDDEGNVLDKSLEKKITKYENALDAYEEAKQALVEAEKSGDEKDIEKAEKKLEKAEKKLNKKQTKMDEELNQYLEDAEGIDYASADEKTRKYLDYIYNTQGKVNIMSGDDQAKSLEIKRIFNKDDLSGAKGEIDELVKKLAKNPGDKTIIDDIREQCALAEKDLKAVGLSIEDAKNYFAQLGSSASYNTIDGKVKEIDEATKRLNGALGNVDTSSVDSIKQALTSKGWVDKDGKVLSDEIAEYFGGEDGGISEETRIEIERLVKQIYDGKITVQDALKSFELFGVKSVIDIQIEEVKTNFKDVFVDLEDADGLINTFEELGSAIGSTVGALEAFNQAQADVEDKGFVSIQTALQLMEYTDDYGSVLQVVDGKLQLAADAEQNLIQARIDAIKVSAQTAVADAQAAYDKAELAVQSYRSAMVEEASASTVATAWQKIVAVAAGIKNALDNIWSGESIGDLYNSGYNTYLEKATGYETSYDDAGLQALEDALSDADKKLNEAKGNAEIANAMTAESLEDLYKSSDKSTLEEVANDAFQKEMDYWENRIGANQAKYEQLQNEIDLLEAKGQKADASFYGEQIKLENERKWLLEQQKAAAQAHLATLKEGSEEWWEVANTLNDIENELDDVTSSILDLQDAIGEIETYKFDEFNTRLDNLISKLDTIRDLIAPNGEEDWFSDEGEWTEAGVAALGTYIQELETYKQGLAEITEQSEKYSLLPYAGNVEYYETLGIHSEQEYYDKMEELIDQQYSYAESISDTEQSIADMYESNIDAVEEYTETLIDSYNDYIDSVKEALDAERDLYDFKKNVQKQSKDIAAIERRIASLSGSTNAADVAERRKLEAQLYESRESLNDTYYDHAKDAQSAALDREAEAYEESMNNMIEGLRTSLEEATLNMDEFLMGVTSMVMYNADTVLSKYEETNLPLTKELTNPWEEAKKATSSYSGNALDLMNQWTKEGGFFAQFNATGTTNLKSPWSAGTTAANSFKTSVSTVMSGVVSNIESNVKKAKNSLASLTTDIKDTNVKNDDTTGDKDVESPPPPPKQYRYTARIPGFVGKGSEKNSVKEAQTSAEEALYRAFETKKKKDGVDSSLILSEFKKAKSHAGGVKFAEYAKGTTGTTRDEWAITDEPKFGDELVLVPGKDGNLSFMRKGTGVVPADLTQKLFELAQIPTSDLMSKSLTAVVPNITKNDFKNEFNFESLVHVDTVDSDTLPKLEKMVDKKIDDFSKSLNYSLKRFAR